MQHITTTHPYRVDLDACPLEAEMSAPLMQQDAHADEIRVHVRRGMTPIDLTDMQVQGFFTRCSTDTVLPLTGTADGSTISVTLPEACYAVAGPFRFTVQLIQGEVRHTLLCLKGQVAPTAAGSVSDPTGTVATLAELLSQMAQLQALTSAAEAVLADAAPPIIATAESSQPIKGIHDAVTGRPPRNIHLYGHTVQEAVPSPDAPQPLACPGSAGTLTLALGPALGGIGGMLTYDQEAVVSVAGGLAGIPFTAGGTCIDKHGQRWLADEIDLARGVIIRRIHRVRLTGTSHAWATTSITGRYAINNPKVAILPGTAPMSTHFVGRTSITTGTGHVTNNNNVQLLFTTDLPTLPDWKAWLDGNEVWLHYALATPYEEPLPEDGAAILARLRMDDCGTIFTNDANAHMTLTYLADTKQYVDART